MGKYYQCVYCGMVVHKDARAQHPSICRGMPKLSTTPGVPGDATRLRDSCKVAITDKQLPAENGGNNE